MPDLEDQRLPLRAYACPISLYRHFRIPLCGQPDVVSRSGSHRGAVLYHTQRRSPLRSCKTFVMDEQEYWPASLRIDNMMCVFSP